MSRLPQGALGLMLAALMVATPALSQTTKKEWAQKILQLQRPALDALADSLAQGAVQDLVQNAGQVLHAKIPEDRRPTVAKAMDQELRAYLKDVQPGLRASVNKHAASVVGARLEADFSEAELKQIVEFLESPVLRRYQQLGAELNGRVTQKVMEDQSKAVETRAKQLDRKLVELLGLKAAAPASSNKP